MVARQRHHRPQSASHASEGIRQLNQSAIRNLCRKCRAASFQYLDHAGGVRWEKGAHGAGHRRTDERSPVKLPSLIKQQPCDSAKIETAFHGRELTPLMRFADLFLTSEN